MPGVSAADRARLYGLLLRRTLRGLVGRAATHPLSRWRYLAAGADRLVLAPQDLRTTDPVLASEIYAGRFAFAGKVVMCDGRSPFDITPPSDEWAVALLGFGWLRHLRAVESEIARTNARALIDEWMTLHGRWHALSWRPDILARRVMAFLNHAPYVLENAHPQFYRRFTRSLTRQVRYLRRAANQADDGLAAIKVAAALTTATLCLEGQARHRKRAARRLTDELQWQILPDGGHVSRLPSAGVDLLLDLLPLRQAFAARDLVPPPELLRAIDRIMPMIRFFRHTDGHFALFNGMGPTPTDLVAAVLAHDDTRGTPNDYAPHAGYQKLRAGDTTLLMDIGRVPPLRVASEAHAGCLSMELSSRQNRIVVNCGLPSINRESWRQVARATAAHSTVTLNDTSSCRFLQTAGLRKIFGVPAVGGPRTIDVMRGEASADIAASHDGYAERFNIVHRRALKLTDDGMRLEGEDSFTPARGETLPPNAEDEFAIRFHLHPAVRANRLTDGHGVMLMLPNREAWTFQALQDRVEMEESVFLAGSDGPRRTAQIVIYGQARHVRKVAWSFTRVPASAVVQAARGKTDRRDAPELPLDTETQPELPL